MTARTRLGKVVGSVRQPLDGWTYWPERHWRTDEPGFIVAAPSGARFTWHADERDALAEVARREGDDS
jgi:hypothetical protein